MPKIAKAQSKEKPAEKKITQEEYEKKIVELSKLGLTAEKIGETLRKEGIHSKEFSKTISQILKAKDIYVSPDLKNVEAKLKKLQNHYEKNKQDKKAMREKDRVFSQVRNIKKYLNIPLK